MKWILFDEADHRTIAPPFCLPATNGKQIGREDFHEDCNLVLVFPHGSKCNTCQGTLLEFGERYPEYQALDARIVAIFPEGIDELKNEAWLSGSPLIFLADPKQSARNAYAALMDASLVSEDESLIFILDKYGAPYSAVVGQEFDDPDLQRDIQSWLSYISVQCPE